MHQFLQHTCIFNRGEDISGEDLDGHLLGNVCWSGTGKLLAGSMDSLVNIWTTGGKFFYCRKISKNELKMHCHRCQLLPHSYINHPFALKKIMVLDACTGKKIRKRKKNIGFLLCCQGQSFKSMT